MNEELVWASSQRVHSLTRSSCFDTLVTSKDLSPYFLEDEHPDLLDSIIFRGSGKGPLLCISVIREIIVDDHSALFAINVHSDGVAAGFVHFIVKEYLLNPFGVFSERAQRREEVAVAALSLFDIVWPRVSI